jgi:putative membrane protein
MNDASLPVFLTVPLAALLGALLGGVAACIPAFHIYGLMGACCLWFGPALNDAAPGPGPAALAIGLVTGWMLVNAVPAILLSAPDESALFTVLPGQRYLMAGRGYEAVMLTAIGAAGGMVFLLGAAVPVPRVLPDLHRLLAPHYHWMIWTVIAFMLISEWPMGRTAALPPWDGFFSGMANTLAGLATFALAGLLGFIMLYRSPLPAQTAFQNLTPVFAGLFALPWLIVNLVGRTRIPSQHTPRSVEFRVGALLKGIAAGTLGGAFAAFVPVVSGGVGGMLAGHATSLRDERAFLVSQGASKAVYYVGGLLLFFVPGLEVARGGAAAMLKLFQPPAACSLRQAAAAAAIAMGVALLMLPLCARLAIGCMNRIGHRALSWAALAVALLLVLAVTGWAGIAVMLVAAGIGLIPALFGSRRMNGLGVILLPMACNMSGVGADVAAWLGLL